MNSELIDILYRLVKENHISEDEFKLIINEVTDNKIIVKSPEPVIIPNQPYYPFVPEKPYIGGPSTIDPIYQEPTTISTSASIKSYYTAIA